MRFPAIAVLNHASLAIGLAMLLPACARVSEEESETEPAFAGEGVEQVSLEGEADRRVFVGDITMVNEKSNFVLIKTPVNQRLEKGIPLQSFDAVGMSAELLFSPEQTQGFMTADIREGTPKIGDQVYLRYTEDFKDGMSPRMQKAMEEFEYKKSLSRRELRKYEREKKSAEKAAKERRAAAAR